jgi:hypothetical protein
MNSFGRVTGERQAGCESVVFTASIKVHLEHDEKMTFSKVVTGREA